MTKEHTIQPDVDATYPPIVGLVGPEGVERLREHPLTEGAIAYSMGVLACRSPIPADGKWRNRAAIWIRRILDPEDDYAALQEYAQQTVDAAHDRQETEELAVTDTLTGLPNRLGFLRDLKRAQAWRLQRKRTYRMHDGSEVTSPQRGVGVGLMDLDFFKNVNDALGHQFGDEVLQRIGGVLAGIMRQGQGGRRLADHEDFEQRPKDNIFTPPSWGQVARLGGDEFAFTLRVYEQSGQGASGRRNHEPLIAEEVFIATTKRIEADLRKELRKINRLVGAECKRQGVDKLPALRASFGWCYNDDGLSEGAMITRVDQRMYERKEQGRLRDDKADMRRMVRVIGSQRIEEIRRCIEDMVDPEVDLVRYRRELKALKRLFSLAA